MGKVIGFFPPQSLRKQRISVRAAPKWTKDTFLRRKHSNINTFLLIQKILKLNQSLLVWDGPNAVSPGWVWFRALRACTLRPLCPMVAKKGELTPFFFQKCDPWVPFLFSQGTRRHYSEDGTNMIITLWENHSKRWWKQTSQIKAEDPFISHRQNAKSVSLN